MFFKARPLEFEAKKPIVILNKDDAEDLGTKVLDRVLLKIAKKSLVAIINIAEHLIPRGEIGLYGSVQEKLNVGFGDKIEVIVADTPKSLLHIRKKLTGNILKTDEIREIIDDIVKQTLSDIEITSFVIALYNHGMTMNETAALSMAMADTGKRLDIKNKLVFDKHSIGGIPGDKTSLLLVPAIASFGLTIPKTSSRSITSPAGTADRMECLCPVELDIDEIKSVVKKTNGCLVWGGAVELAPADDIFIQIEYPLSIDPLLLPSVMSKKKAVNARYVVIDIPTGKGAKMKTIEEAQDLGKSFIELGKKLGIKVECASTFGEQPLGYAIGPALEAREALRTLLTGKGPDDLVGKVVHLGSVLLDFKRVKNSKQKMYDSIRSGKAGEKMREIIEEQGGNPNVKPEDVPVGSDTVKIKSSRSGKVLWLNNNAIRAIARSAGAPKDKGAGILLYKKLNDPVKKGETLFEIYTEKSYKLERALRDAKNLNVVGVGKSYEMVLAEIPEEEEHRKYFILER
jgi:AMP phosphorylase